MFKISENKRIYRGCIERSIDQQRVLNYALSRDIEQGALAPRDKLFMTPKQAAEWVFYKDPDFVNPFDTGSQQWLEFSDELFFLQVGI